MEIFINRLLFSLIDLSANILGDIYKKPMLTNHSCALKNVAMFQYSDTAVKKAWMTDVLLGDWWSHCSNPSIEENFENKTLT